MDTGRDDVFRRHALVHDETDVSLHQLTTTILPFYAEPLCVQYLAGIASVSADAFDAFDAFDPGLHSWTSRISRTSIVTLTLCLDPDPLTAPAWAATIPSDPSRL
jgi:hypothetical protein